jgi:hypothetical protein
MGKDSLDSDKMRTAVSEALQSQHGVTVTAWFYRHDQEPKAYPKIDDREKAQIIKNIKIGNSTLPVSGPRIIMPSHPFQLIIAANRLPPKESLDNYCAQFGYDSSHMITNERGQDVYLLLLNSIESVARALANWHPAHSVLGDIPPPQSLYAYNGGKPPSQSSDEVRELKQQIQTLSTAGESKIDNAVSKLTSLHNSMETKLERKMGEAGTILTQNIAKVFAEQQKDSQNFQREMMSNSQEFQTSMLNMFVTAQQNTVNYINESQARNQRISLLQSDLMELISKRQSLRDRVAALTGSRAITAPPQIQEINRNIEEISGEISANREQQTRLLDLPPLQVSRLLDPPTRGNEGNTARIKGDTNGYASSRKRQRGEDPKEPIKVPNSQSDDMDIVVCSDHPTCEIPLFLTDAVN